MINTDPDKEKLLKVYTAFKNICRLVGKMLQVEIEKVGHWQHTPLVLAIGKERQANFHRETML